MTQDIPFPPVPEALLLALETRFKDTLPTALPPYETFARLVGQQEVIRFLRHQFNEQTNPQQPLEE